MKKFALLLPLAAPLLALGALGPAAIPASAHHSYSMFDMQKTIVLDATVTQFRWQNPHAFIAVEVDEDGTKQRWSIEMTSPNNLVQSGWRRTSLRTGDKIRLWVHPLRSGARGASYIGVRLPDGSTLGDVG
ncbi:hypothetical protein D2V17_14105 [Aurantiacibacter xanthus]|uniref:Uncharacterized protein n=1 Tax=Aurantiacibacter xanthus TaxID=1784712 RepID=A0A3A1P1A7_9SPHN|nr:DUF6152 family protein [Aurantiacibacter xanthus]RIV82933.1 hypothetical protein D2V17_14105 [Aurantiacibacter xanthus]